MLMVAHLSRWLGERGLGCDDLTCEIVDEFFGVFHRSWCRTSRSLAPVLAYLRGIGAVPAARSVPVGRTPAEIELWESFRRWCVDRRGLKASTAEEYVRRAEQCVRSCDSQEITVGDLDGPAVLGAVRAAARSLPGPSLRCTVTALRSFLRFLHATGRTASPLVGAVPPIRERARMMPALSVVSEASAKQLISSCDTMTATGRRDVAILVVLCRLALRSHEVAGLTLDDVDWRRGELRVAGKGGRIEVLPLPSDVGEAIADYLTAGRPEVVSRALFVKAVAPFGPMSPDGVNAVVRLACDRAGLPRVGPHQLRHLVATSTLRAGASLTEVAQLLRHTDLTTAAIYANADPVAVAALARPWPGTAR